MKRDDVVAYVTKYALTQGILKISGRVSASGYFYGNGAYFELQVNPSNWTLDKCLAIERAEKMRDKKIASLKRQIARLQKLDFTNV